MSILNQVIKALAIIIIGILVFVIFIKTEVKPEKKPVPIISRRVNVEKIIKGTYPVEVDAMGTVCAANDIDIVAEVGGRVIWVSPNFVPGGHFKKDEEMLRIEPYDYEIAVEEAKANLEIARRDLLAEQGKQRWAKSIEKDSRTSTSNVARDLRLRVPHVKAAEAKLASAEKTLENSRRDLVRTSVKAPMNLIILEEGAELGRYITLRTSVGKAVGTDRFWVKASVPLLKVAAVKIPGVNAAVGSNVRVIMSNIHGQGIHKSGRIIKLMPDLQEEGKMARLLIEVDDPLGLDEKKISYPLLINSFVRLEIEGKEFKNVARLPRSALRVGDELWFAVGDEKQGYVLKKRKVDVLWRMEKYLLVNGSLKGGELLVTSYLPAPVEGMKLEVDFADNAEVADNDGK